MIQKNIRYLMLTAMLLLAGGSVWGTTYYLIGSSNSDNPAQWSKLAENTSTEFTLSLAFGNNYMAISTSQSIANYISASGKSYSFSSDDAWEFQTKEWSGYYYVWANVKSAGTYTILYDGNTYTLVKGSGTVYTVTPSITGGTISPATAQSVTSGSSVTFTVTPTTSYVFTSAAYSGTKSGDISQAGNSFTLTPTSSGTLSIVYSAPAASYTITTSGTNCSFNETSKSIATGGSFDFVVTPNEGYKITNIAVTNATASPSGSVNYTTATTINVSNPTANGTLTITTAAVSANRAPTVRIGAKPVIGADCGLTTYAYFAQRGCANITNVTLYYSNSRAFRIDGKNRTASKSKSVSNPAMRLVRL